MKYFKNKLSNGSSLSTITIPNAPSITVTSYIKAGFRSDPDGMPGLAHCTEHMLFAGSEKFPSHYILASNVEKVGGWHYAYTWIDYQQHEICIPYQYANIAVDILLDTLFNSLINKSEFIKEKEVIKKEILRYRYDMDRFLLYYVWFPLIFQGTKLVEPCIGSEEKIDEFKYTDIKKFLEANFVANNMTFIISGNISQQKSLDLFEKKIKSITPSIFSSIIPTIAPGKKDQILIFPYESDQIGIAIGIPTVPKANGKRHAFDIFENMLSRGFGGSISDKLREAGGLVYSLYSSQENLLDSGFLVFTTMTEKKNAKKVLQIILKEFNRMRIGAFTQEEIENAVKNLVGSLQIGLETSNAIAHWYGLQELLNPREILHPEDKIAKYKSLSKKELANIAHEYFAKKNIYIGILGDIKKQEVQNLID